MWDMERQCHRAPSHLVIYSKWYALGELEKIKMKNAIIKSVPFHKSIFWEELIGTFLAKYRSNPLYRWSISDSERDLPSIPCARRTWGYESRTSPKVYNLITWWKSGYCFPFLFTLISLELLLNLVIGVFSFLLAVLVCFPLQECIIRVWNLI